MAIPEMNGVSNAQGVSAGYELQKPAEKTPENVPVGQAPNGEQPDRPMGWVIQTLGNNNSFYKNSTYTKDDFSQLKKYSDNIASDLNRANSRLGDKYAKIENTLVKAMRAIGNPNDPNFITAQSYLSDLRAITAKTKEDFNFPKGGKEANYKDAQATVDRYEQSTQKLLDSINEDSTFVALMNATKEIKANTNENAAKNAAITVAYGEANLEATEQEGVKTRKTLHNEAAATRKAVRNEGAKTRNTVRAEGQATRATVHAEGAMTRNTVRNEGARTRNTIRQEAVKTRNTVRQTGQETQEINEMSNQVSDVLNTEYHTGETKKQVGNMRDKIVSSNLPHESKKEMLNDLTDFSDQVVITDHEIKDKQKDVDLRIAIERDTQESEVPEREAPSLREYPVYEDPYANTETKNPPKTSENRGSLAPEKEPSILDKPFWKK